MKPIKKIVFFTLLLVTTIVLTGGLYYTGKLGPHPRLVKTTFGQLPHWQEDAQEKALNAFKQSCTAILKLDPDTSFHSMTDYGKTNDWQIICLAAYQIKKINKQNARQFFEVWFDPYQVENNFNKKGLFTGYYLPLIHGRLKRNKHYNIPIYGLPEDLVKVNLRLFPRQSSQETIIGQLKDHQLYPYPDRAAIVKGTLGKKTPVLVWGNNMIDIFFAQIQGSAIVQLPHHKQMVIGYISGNGHPYTAIGKVLLHKNALKREEVSMQSIRAWLNTHPNEVNNILNQNANYVFFRILKDKDPLGSQQVPVTPEHSLAVDPRYIALGAPIWLDTTIPNETQPIPFQHLLIAQDTGGDIKGVVRGDVYWGAGDKAAWIAGHMASRGEYWVLLPKSISPKN